MWRSQYENAFPKKQLKLGTTRKFGDQADLHDWRTYLAVGKCCTSTTILISCMTEIKHFINFKQFKLYQMVSITKHNLSMNKNTYGAIIALAGPCDSSAAPNQFSNWLPSSFAVYIKNIFILLNDDNKFYMYIKTCTI